MISLAKNTLLLLTTILTFAVDHSNGQCSFIQADRFDNIWVANGAEVTCFNKQLVRIGSYSNIVLGNPSSVDMLDPFRVLVFYPQSQSIVILNNAIAEISKPIYLRDKGLIDVSLVCRSSKGGIWVLDRTSWAIIYFDSGFNRTGETMIPDMTYSGSKPMFMQEKNQILYIAFQGKGICRFDSFGARLGDIPAEVDTFFTLNDNTIIYSTGGKLYQYSLENNQIIDFNSPCSCIPAIVQGKFLIFDGSRLVVCKI